MAKGTFENKIVIISGGSNILGVTLAELYALTGAKVTILDVDKPALDEKISGLTKKGLKIKAFAGDFNDNAEMENFLVQFSYTPDVLVNMGGVDIFFNANNVNPDGSEELIQSVLKASRNCIKYFAKVMNDGSIINILPFPPIVPNQSGASLYSSVKEGFHFLTGIYARQLAPSGIKVNSIVPGYFAEILDIHTKEVVKSIKEKIPTGEVGTFNDIFNVCHFLSGSDSGYITGATIPVDGGYFS